MGSRTSKAKKACITEKTINVKGSVTSGGIDVTKRYDTQCVQNILDKKT